MTTAFGDESKARDYIVVAAVLQPSGFTSARRAIEGMRMRGQRRIHFAKESDSRRREILSTLTRLEVSATAYRSAEGGDAQRRARCLRALAADAASGGVERVVLERDETTVRADRQVLFGAFQALGRLDIGYEHAAAVEESLLVIPDVVAWCLQRGGPWKRRVDGLLASVRRV